jgi:hypothetical protein
MNTPTYGVLPGCPMSHLRSTTALPALVLVIAGCSQDPMNLGPNPALSPEGAPVVMSAGTYTLKRTPSGWKGELPFTFSNGTGRTVSLVNCNRAYSLWLEKQVADDWVLAWQPVFPMCLSPAIRIAPDGAREDVARISAGHRGSNVYPQFEVTEIDGTYRLVIGGAFWNYNHDGPPWGEPLPLEHRISAPFEIRTVVEES